MNYPLTTLRSPAAVEIERELKNLIKINDGQVVYSSSGSEACDIVLSILSDLGPVITLNGGNHGLSSQYLKKSKYDELEYGKKFILSFLDNKGVFEELNELVSHRGKSIFLEELQNQSRNQRSIQWFLRGVKEKFPEILKCVDEPYTGMVKTGELFHISGKSFFFTW
ncbi:MAG: hypothetical protein QXZ17_11000 [Nitrososphaerota archaeon]